jgi:hypothetical protein
LRIARAAALLQERRLRTNEGLERAQAMYKCFRGLPVTGLERQSESGRTLEADIRHLKHGPLSIVAEAAVRTTILVRILPVMTDHASIAGDRGLLDELTKSEARRKLRVWERRHPSALLYQHALRQKYETEMSLVPAQNR